MEAASGVSEGISREGDTWVPETAPALTTGPEGEVGPPGHPGRPALHGVAAHLAPGWRLGLQVRPVLGSQNPSRFPVLGTDQSLGALLESLPRGARPRTSPPTAHRVPESSRMRAVGGSLVSLTWALPASPANTHTRTQGGSQRSITQLAISKLAFRELIFG